MSRGHAGPAPPRRGEARIREDGFLAGRARVRGSRPKGGCRRVRGDEVNDPLRGEVAESRDLRRLAEPSIPSNVTNALWSALVKPQERHLRHPSCARPGCRSRGRRRGRSPPPGGRDAFFAAGRAASARGFGKPGNSPRSFRGTIRSPSTRRRRRRGSSPAVAAQEGGGRRSPSAA